MTSSSAGCQWRQLRVVDVVVVVCRRGQMKIVCHAGPRTERRRRQRRTPTRRLPTERKLRSSSTRRYSVTAAASAHRYHHPSSSSLRPRLGISSLFILLAENRCNADLSVLCLQPDQFLSPTNLFVCLKRLTDYVSIQSVVAVRRSVLILGVSLASSQLFTASYSRQLYSYCALF